MLHYRLYWMNELGHIEQAGEFDAENDATAIAAAMVRHPKGEALGRYPDQLADRFNLRPLNAPGSFLLHQ